jgi:hypothetical protein
MTAEIIAAAVAALRNGQLKQYEELAAFVPTGESSVQLLKAVGEAHGNSFDLLKSLSAWPTAGLTFALRRVMPAVEYVPTFASGDATLFLEFAARVGPSYRHTVSKNLQLHISSEMGLGRTIGMALRDADVLSDGALRVWAQAYSNAAPKHAAQFLLDLLGGAERDAVLLATLLQYLPTRDPGVVSILQPREAELSSCLLSLATQAASEMWPALTAIADFSPCAMNALNDAVEDGDVHALNTVAAWLYMVSTPSVGATNVPLEALLKNLLRYAVEKSEVRRNVDSGVGSLLRRGSLRGLVIACIAELGHVDANVAELFTATFDELCEKPEDFKKLLTEWLLAERISFSAIRSLISRCISQRAPASLDGATFASAPRHRKVAAMRRLLSITHNGPALCDFIESLAETPVMQPDGLELAAHMLNEVSFEYPNATLQFLQPRTRPFARRESYADVYRGIYANTLRWRRVLNQLPKLNELMPTESQHHALRAMRQRFNRDVLRGASELSIFASLATKMHLAQGRRFASHRDHGVSQVAEMREASHSIELPASELADPVGGMLRRARAMGESL